VLTYDVQIWGIRKRPNRVAAYQLRWRVGPRPFSKSYKIKAQADGRRSELLAALRNREQFDTETGLPASEVQALNSTTWYRPHPRLCGDEVAWRFGQAPREHR
jgi:hypothetical protein